MCGARRAPPFRQDGLLEHPNLIGIARQRHEAYRQELLAIEAARQELAAQRQAWVEKRAPLKAGIDLLTNEIKQNEAMLAGDMQRVAELQEEASSLQQQLPTRCDAGNRLLRDCSHVMARIEQTQIDRKQRITLHQRFKEELESELALLRRRRDELEAEAAPMNAEVAAIDQRKTELMTRHAQSLSADQFLSDAIEDYEHYEGITSGRSQSADIVAVERKLESTRYRHEQLQIQHEKERQAVKGRRRAISESMQAIAKSLPSFQWGVFNDEARFRRVFWATVALNTCAFVLLCSPLGHFL